MDSGFWHERWAANKIAWHQADVHPHLKNHIDRLTDVAGSRVLVPLCGKSLDLAWLAAAGHEPIGVELVESAVRAFYDEHDITPSVNESSPPIKRFSGGGVVVFCADIFDLASADVGPIDAIWDRGATVALPPETRRRYTAALGALANRGPRRMLLTALDYDQRVMSGPPFSVTESEVRELHANGALEVLERADVVDRVPFEGHTFFNSTAYLIELGPRTAATRPTS